MYALRDFGSFHVGGRTVSVSGEEKRMVRFTADLELEYDPNGDFLIEQVYVQFFIPAEQTFPHPLVLLHGGGLTGACWETTPDGRPGWLHDFLRQGFAVYVIDNVERGRSGFCALEGVWEGEPVMRTPAVTAQHIGHLCVRALVFVQAYWMFSMRLSGVLVRAFTTSRPCF